MNLDPVIEVTITLKNLQVRLLFKTLVSIPELKEAIEHVFRDHAAARMALVGLLETLDQDIILEPHAEAQFTDDTGVIGNLTVESRTLFLNGSPTC